jgi:hypothetical protein
VLGFFSARLRNPQFAQLGTASGLVIVFLQAKHWHFGAMTKEIYSIYFEKAILSEMISLRII